MQVTESKITAEGRVVLPAPIRRVLGVAAGDRVQFLVDEAGQVRLVTARRLREQIWANNQPSAKAGSVMQDLVRADRALDARQAERPTDRLSQPATDIADEVLALLGP